MKRRFTLLLFLLFAGIAILQAQGTISGTVTSSEDNQPVAGASVLVQGTTVATITDADGKFTLTLPKNAKSIIISFIGLKTVQLSIEGKSTIAVQLEPDVLGLDEIIVTAVGIGRTEKSLGYSVASVSPDQAILKSEPDLMKSLEGKVPGLDIRLSQGAPGAATRINLRGNSSFSGDNQPLIIVDGVPYSNDQVTTSDQISANGGAYSSGLSSLDPNSIADISILKGANAAALYGSRAANGVIIIKTKAGTVKAGKKGIGIVLNSSLAWEKIGNLPEYQNTYGNGSEFNYANANGSWGPRFDSLDSIPAWPAYLNSSVGDSLFPTGLVPYVAQPDNVKSLFNTGLIAENSATIAGGTDKTSFTATASTLNQNGYIPDSKFNRYSLNVGGASKFTDKLTIGANLSTSRTNQVGGYFGENQFDGAASSFARNLFLGRTWNMNLPYEDPATGFPLSTNPSQYDNPLWSFKHNQITTITDRTVAGFNVDYNIFSWMNLNYNIGINSMNLSRKQVTDIGSRAANGQGQIITEDYRNTEIESNLLLTFAQKIGEDISLKAIIGHNVNQRTSNDQSFSGKVMVSPGIYDLNNTMNVISNGIYYSQRRLWAMFGDFEVGYKNYLFLNITGRNDWSSTLPEANRSYFYPSVSTSFVFTDAIHIDPKILSLGKIRASWANVGNDAPPYSLYESFVKQDLYMGQIRLTIPSLLPNANLEPEKTKELELGAQLAFLNSRLSTDISWYNRVSTNQIAEVQVARSSGYDSRYINTGKMRNRGIEIGVGITPVKIPNGLEWNMNIVFFKNINKVLELAPGVDRIALINQDLDVAPVIEKNQPFGVLRGTYALRDSATNALIIDPSTGYAILAQDEKIVGDPNPDFKTSLMNTIRYKGFTLSFLFDWTQGGDIYSITIQSLLGRGVTKDTEDREHAYIVPGYYGSADGTLFKDKSGKPIANRTAISSNDLYFNGYGGVTTFSINDASEFSMYDATVYRLRELTIGYDIPKSLYNKIAISGITVSVSARNLWYLAPNVPKYTHFDPETGSIGNSNVQGIELSTAPSPRRYGINLQIKF